MTDLARLYVLCARIQALESLKAAFRDYIGRTGLALVLDEQKVCSLLTSLCSVLNKTGAVPVTGQQASVHVTSSVMEQDA